MSLLGSFVLAQMSRRREKTHCKTGLLLRIGLSHLMTPASEPYQMHIDHAHWCHDQSMTSWLDSSQSAVVQELQSGREHQTLD